MYSNSVGVRDSNESESVQIDRTVNNVGSQSKVDIGEYMLIYRTANNVGSESGVDIEYMVIDGTTYNVRYESVANDREYADRYKWLQMSIQLEL